MTAGYAIGSAVLFVGALGPEGGWVETLVATVGLLLMVAGTAHVLLLRGRVFAPSPAGTTSRPRWGLLVISIGVLLLGVGVVVVGVHDLVDNLRPVSASSRRADGVVIRIESVTTSSGSERRTTHHPVVRFLTAREQVIVFTSSQGGGNYRTGDAVKVRYDLNHPDRARLDALGDRVEGAILAVVMLLGALGGMVGGGVLFVRAASGTPPSD